MDNIQIRPMTVLDAKEVAVIHTESWQYAYKGIVPQDYLDAIDADKRAVNWAKGIEEDSNLIRLVAVEEGKILGFACGLNTRDKQNPHMEAELWAIYVSPKEINKKVGSTLFEAFKTSLLEKNMMTMNIWVFKDNHNARKFYEKMGGKLSTYKKIIEIDGEKLAEVSYEYDFNERDK